MTDVFISSDNIITSLGFSTGENAANMLADNTGIQLTENERIAPVPFYASLINSEQLYDRFSTFDDPDKFTRFEQLAICSLKDALSDTEIDFTDSKTLFILSTTKGNIDLLEKENEHKFGRERIYLWNTARLLQSYFKFLNEPVVISNACISGVQAIITGARLIRANLFENVVINGTDIITEFVLSGFNSFQSLSTGPCRPFDKTRNGLSLGEGSGTIILTSKPVMSGGTNYILVGEGFSTNDANHISGPSRTGEGLFIAINRLLKKSPLTVDYISAHGTATLYNDEMESIAITRAGLQSVPINSFKGYWGHTLGAAGIIESIMGIWSIKNSVILNTKGYNESGVTNPIFIVNKPVQKEINTCLKIASGFGGCNAALIFYKK
ncbi:MAG: beta-ketoacyl synthase N-terminal-like domain-containing protein [Bacteroidia bacterium]|nr:beta-ketoacyl synthase N-terminal-like domain-containing protein [Bacteroidia bacterium]